MYKGQLPKTMQLYYINYYGMLNNLYTSSILLIIYYKAQGLQKCFFYYAQKGPRIVLGTEFMS